MVITKDFSGNVTQTESRNAATPVYQTDPVRIIHQEPVEVNWNEATIRIKTDQV